MSASTSASSSASTPAAPLATSSAAAAAKERELLRIVIVGHVDHGKSTLVGRLLHETGSLPDGKLEMLKEVSARRGMPFEWSFLLDALQTERDQGITVDTSQIRFKTAQRDYVLIDAPGHVEFLRNMVTGAAQADAAVLLVDAGEGVREQTRRHAFLLHLLGLRQVAVVVNKMDRVAFDQEAFAVIEEDVSAYLAGFGLRPTFVIPVSARDGDFISERTARLPWYSGPTVVEALDAFTAPPSLSDQPLRFPIQAVYKFDERRILAGRIESGRLSVGDELAFEPSGATARVKSIEAWPGPGPTTVEAGQSVGITLDKDIFVTRGDIAAHGDQRPRAAKSLKIRLFWLDDAPLKAGDPVVVRLSTAAAPGVVSAVTSAVDPANLVTEGQASLGRNYVGEVEISLRQALPADPYHLNAFTGRVVVERERRICGGGIILHAAREARLEAPKRGPVVAVDSAVTPAERVTRFHHQGAVLWLTGLPAAGKSTVARATERRLFDLGGSPVYLDGDTLRTGLNADLGFSPQERSENIRRVAHMAGFLARNGHIAIVALVSPTRADREQAREVGGRFFHEVFIRASLEVCEGRDPKGHYAKARKGEIASFTGISAPYEEPEAPELVLDTTVDVTASVAALEAYLEEAGVLFPPDTDSPI
ncbi:adenylyl-sulfate kinase [Xanthobacter autotrophicus]|uniref:adenylyl-sulfate kinase n=1 Tax=Xanthobacter autotrophicus TaxID=280 RepID=UPI0024A72069|nr:adenylyl-sulfate kinase [Xanthobacter autotrophicus]MDI4658908.1 adenylyl-sulfate kinase [Xanthobacter autotrophicus]